MHNLAFLLEIREILSERLETATIHAHFCLDSPFVAEIERNAWFTARASS